MRSLVVDRASSDLMVGVYERPLASACVSPVELVRLVVLSPAIFAPSGISAMCQGAKYIQRHMDDPQVLK